MNQNKGIWVGVVSLIVIAALGLWYLAANRPLGMLSMLGPVPTTTEDVSGTESPKAAPKPVPTGDVVVKKEVRKQDVATIIRNLKTVSTFNGYFRSTGIAATINPKSETKYTILAPTNGAFAQLPVGTVGSMSTDEKKRLIQYHVVSGRQIDPDALSTGSIEAVSRDVLNFSYGPDKIPMVNSAIVITQYEGTNGVVIVIDNVLLPPKK